MTARTTRCQFRRKGASMMEVLTVVVIIVVFGAIALPTLREFNGNSRITAAADTIKGRIADARAAAMDTGRPYRLAINVEGTMLRVSPDDAMFQNSSASDFDSDMNIMIGEVRLPTDVIARLLESDESASMDDNGWLRVASFRPDGTCREDNVTIQLTEVGQIPLLVVIRGLTGTASVIKSNTPRALAP